MHAASAQGWGSANNSRTCVLTSWPSTLREMEQQQKNYYTNKIRIQNQGEKKILEILSLIIPGTDEQHFSHPDSCLLVSSHAARALARIMPHVICCGMWCLSYLCLSVGHSQLWTWHGIYLCGVLAIRTDLCSDSPCYLGMSGFSLSLFKLVCGTAPQHNTLLCC